MPKKVNTRAKATKAIKLLDKPSRDGSFPIVAIGASAGGLEALESFFSHAPANSDIAYVIITHLDPTHNSLLPELLQKITKIKVIQITNGLKLQANCIYVIPPGKEIYLQQETFKLQEQKISKGIHLPIDIFFQSLAKQQEHKIASVILSGAGSDGTQGLQAIHQAGGLKIAQDPDTAKYSSMPSNAINTGLINYVLPPEKIPEQLLHSLNNDPSTPLPEKNITKELSTIFHLLHTHVGHDFSSYKYNTICRRVEKRMRAHQITTIKDYVSYLQKNPTEAKNLFKNLLISVTNFFRNPESFEALKKALLTNLLKKRSSDYCIRIWVPACATGEEAYSLAILLQECMEETHQYFNVQIFATDIDESAIEVARAGVYSHNIKLDMSPKRLKRFFTQEGKEYKISKDIRKMVIFAVQNVITDPPFTKLTLISCRNLLIYLQTKLQKKILPVFHYSLNYDGILFLGSAENIGNFTDLFKPLDKKWKLFERQQGASAAQAIYERSTTLHYDKMENKPMSHTKQQSKDSTLAQIIKALLLESYAPACIAVDENNNIIYIHGKTGKYLEPAPGTANLNILQMARTGLETRLASALQQATQHKKQVSYKNLQIKDNEKLHDFNLIVKPFDEFKSNENCNLVIIEEIDPSQRIDFSNTKHASNKKLLQQINALEQELKNCKENLQSNIEELETSNEELKSSNEELQSTNEELQSTNEELETSKEELQSLNEELSTVNAELETKIQELSDAHNDMQNLFHSTEIATIFLDNNLCIKRFTPKITELIHLINTDIGRPISDITSKLKYDTLVEDAQNVLNTLSLKTTEVQNKEGQWYQMRILAYRTLHNTIDGVVITFLNIDAQKKAEEKVIELNKKLNIT